MRKFNFNEPEALVTALAKLVNGCYLVSLNPEMYEVIFTDTEEGEEYHFIYDGEDWGCRVKLPDYCQNKDGYFPFGLVEEFEAFSSIYDNIIDWLYENVEIEDDID